MPSSISTVREEGVPSSSTVSEPRRSLRVPSSTTVTPGEAMRWPTRPENAEVFLRLKSPSSPWPIASCSMTPGQPGPSTTLISPAGAGTDDDADVEADERSYVADAGAVGADDLHRLPRAGERGHDLADACVFRAR